VGSIRLDSWNWGVSNSNSGLTGKGSSRPSYQDFAFTANVGRHSSELFLAVVEGRGLANAVLTVLSDGAELLKVTFTDVFISGYKIDESGKIGLGLADAAVTLSIAEPASTDLAKPVESVAFTFRRVDFQGGGGNTTTATVS
jgi:type VI protein secretion system component Hcp